MKHNTPHGGFSLLEILIAMIIFVLGSISIWVLYTAAIESHNRTVDETTVSLLVESVVADLQDGRIQSGKNLPTIQNQSDPNFPGYTYSVSLSPSPSNSAILADIIIFYRRKGVTQKEVFQTVVNPTLPIKK